MGPSFLPLHYWTGVREALEALGCRIIITKVPRAADISVRATALKNMLEQRLEPGEEVNLVGHSMGGLDCRYMISKLLPEAAKKGEVPFKVKSLTTISTPHHGSSIASFANITTFFTPLTTLLAKSPSLDFRAFLQLTPTYLSETFTPQTPNDPSVAYFSYGADATRQFEKLNPIVKVAYPMFWTWEYLGTVEGPNDGLVSVESARWGEYIRTLDADHVDLINLFNQWKWEAALKAANVSKTVGDAAGAVAGAVGAGDKAEQAKEAGRMSKKEVEMDLKKDEEKKQFNAIMLYLEIATMLADRGF
ncbi:hypothetical protein HK097_005429 [Rhizophlyctis rosea]|uniref:GPI inositol-deacylase n=1 Tax=Rhizophlyctis rosea TaxID=64517 RepID=A0AAD5S2D3_9FUNG|nr:hypothetical protein HK097_005429 [Rhizophlyctis rosea]